MKAEIDINIILKLIEGKSSSKIVVQSLKVFSLTKKTYKKQISIYLISLIVATFVGISYDTRDISIDFTQMILDVMLALFGIVFTGYAFFQALINDELLVRLVANTTKSKNEIQEKSKLQESNESFVECMMLNLLAVIISLLLKIIINSISNDFLMFDEKIFNDSLAIALISFYFYFILTIIWEVKSFIFNIFQLFNAYAGTRVLKLTDKNSDNDE